MDIMLYHIVFNLRTGKLIMHPKSILHFNIILNAKVYTCTRIHFKNCIIFYYYL